MKRPGRRPGQPRRMTCGGCGRIDLTMAGHPYRCDGCGPVDREYGLGKTQAAQELSNKIKAGEIPTWRGRACADCGDPAIGYDHRDYNQPLRVDPICARCNIRRGPAIPRHGSMRRMFERGRAPYRSGRHARMLGKMLNINLPPIPPRLTLEDWAKLLPLFEAA